MSAGGCCAVHRESSGPPASWNWLLWRETQQTRWFISAVNGKNENTHRRWGGAHIWHLWDRWVKKMWAGALWHPQFAGGCVRRYQFTVAKRTRVSSKTTEMPSFCFDWSGQLRTIWQWAVCPHKDSQWSEQIGEDDLFMCVFATTGQLCSMDTSMSQGLQSNSTCHLKYGGHGRNVIKRSVSRLLNDGLRVPLHQPELRETVTNTPLFFSLPLSPRLVANLLWNVPLIKSHLLTTE